MRKKTNCKTVDAFVPARHRPGWYRRSVPTPRSARTPSAPRHGIAEASRTAARPELTPAPGGWVCAKDIRDTMSLDQNANTTTVNAEIVMRQSTSPQTHNILETEGTSPNICIPPWASGPTTVLTASRKQNRAHQQRAAPPMQVNHSVVFSLHGVSLRAVRCSM